MPEFIFDEYGQDGVYGAEKTPGMPGAVHGQVANHVRRGIIPVDFQTGRGEKGEQDTNPWLGLPEAFDEGPALFEFPEGGTMEPGYGTGFPLKTGLQVFQETLSPPEPEPGLGVPKGGEPYE
jgi:hypothetical protein